MSIVSNTDRVDSIDKAMTVAFLLEEVQALLLFRIEVVVHHDAEIIQAAF